MIPGPSDKRWAEISEGLEHIAYQLEGKEEEWSKWNESKKVLFKGTDLQLVD